MTRFLLIFLLALVAQGTGPREAKAQDRFYTEVQLGMETPHLDAMVEFLGRCGFSSLAEPADSPHWQIMSDGTMRYFLSEERKPRTLIHLFVRNLDSVVSALEARRVSFFMTTRNGSHVRSALCKAPNGLVVGLYPVYDMQDGMELYPSRGEWTLESILTRSVDPDEAERFWSAFGFRASHDSSQPEQSRILSDGRLTIRSSYGETSQDPVLVFSVRDLEVERRFLLQQGLELYQEGRSESGQLTTLFLRLPDGRIFVLR